MHPAESTPAWLERIRQQAAAGQIEGAETTCRQLLQTAPQEAEAHSWLGLLASARGAWVEAESCLRQALELGPNNPNYWSYLSTALCNQGRASEAEECARRALELDSRQAIYWASLGAALRDQRRWSEAIAAYRQALALDPDNAALWQALASAEQDSGSLDSAEQAFERSLAIAPSGEAAIGLAYLLSMRGKPHEAIELMRAFLIKSPTSAMGWVVLSHALKLMGEYSRAEAACRQALELAPKFHQSRHLFAELLVKRWALSEAEACARQLVADDHNYAAGWAILGLILSAGAQQQAAIAALRRAVDIDKSPHYHSRLLCVLQYADEVEPEKLRCAHEEWDAMHGQKAAQKSPHREVPRPANQKLTLGFVSGDFCQHPVGFLVLPALERLAKNSCVVVCYSDRVAEDGYTARFRAASDQWRNICGTSDDEVAEQIRRDGIDVLVDLAGHQGERLSVFARKPAPVQVTWLGYVGTTGLATMDCILADRHHIRPSEEAGYVEAVLRMPRGYACYGPPVDAYEVTPLPAAFGTPFTFGCFNHPAKLCQSNFAAWAEILHRVPRSQLLLKYGGLDDRGVQQRILFPFEERGIRPDRIIFEGAAICREIMASYGRVDLALDTQPYSGGLTTCEALWMGVPVITMPGKTFAGRHTTSHLTTAGYPQFVADSREAYIEMAVQWAGRIEELAAIRVSLREQVRSSPLCDARQFANDLLNVLQAVRK